jgi:DNA-binding winged helix-turn-helix (wHTH) protein/tetratricopeptide (TPR) repeat protein
MSGSNTHIYEFAGIRVDRRKRVLLREGVSIPLTPKVFDTLLYLVEHQGEVLEKEVLMRAIWPDTIVEENNLSQNISVLRRVLGDDRGENRYIVTVPGKGYRFIPLVESVGTAPANPQEHLSRETIGVLPFENIGAGPEREYLADGLTEETIASLGQIDPDHLSVIGRTSVMRYKGTTKTLAEIGLELAAGYLIESSLRAEGGRLRITSKLIRVSDQLHVWSASFDSEPSSMLTFQRQLSAAIAEQVHLRLSPERLSALARRQTHNAEAYDLYLRGRHFWQQLTPSTTKRAVEYFVRATELDPNYALAWAGQADAYSAGPVTGDAPPLSVHARARDAATKAVQAEAGLAEAQTSLGFVAFWLDWTWAAAEAAFKRANMLDPSYPMAYRMIGILYSHMRRHHEAAVAMRRLRELDPLLPINQALSAQVAFAARDFPAAVRFARQAIALDPEFWVAYLQLAQAREQLNENELALDALNMAGRFCGGNSKVIALRGFIFARMGRTDEALQVLRTLETISQEKYIPPYAIALVQAGLGVTDSAMEWLERAYEKRDVHLVFLTMDPKWDAYRTEARYAAVLKRCAFTALDLPANS